MTSNTSDYTGAIWKWKTRQIVGGFTKIIDLYGSIRKSAYGLYFSGGDN